jgi:hypothetical protein
MKTTKTIAICAKCSDMFSATLAVDNKIVSEYDGYVPDWFPNPFVSHGGDYVNLTIDIETGKILNWKKPTKKDLDIFRDFCHEVGF